MLGVPSRDEASVQTVRVVDPRGLATVSVLVWVRTPVKEGTEKAKQPVSEDVTDKVQGGLLER